LATDARDPGDQRGRPALRDKLAGTGDARSLPSPQEFPRDLDLHRLGAQRPLQPRDLAAQLVGLGALRLALQALGAGGQKLLTPLAQQAVGDVVLATGSAIVFGPRSDASTISVFCWAVNFRYLRVSLNDCSRSVERPIL
jgi:hypothetical protein